MRAECHQGRYAHQSIQHHARTGGKGKRLRGQQENACRQQRIRGQASNIVGVKVGADAVQGDVLKRVNALPDSVASQAPRRTSGASKPRVPKAPPHSLPLVRRGLSRPESTARRRAALRLFQTSHLQSATNESDARGAAQTARKRDRIRPPPRGRAKEWFEVDWTGVQAISPNCRSEEMSRSCFSDSISPAGAGFQWSGG